MPPAPIMAMRTFDFDSIMKSKLHKIAWREGKCVARAGRLSDTTRDSPTSATHFTASFGVT
jgi:hypothetical protein